jgi:hypothetical protein
MFPVSPGEFIPEDAPEWALARLGRITASKRITEALGSIPTRNKLLDELEYELRNGESASKFEGNWATRHGNKFEDQALAEYDMARVIDGEMTKKPGFTVSQHSALLGASPDFLIGSDVVGQVKCPAGSKNHLALLYGGAGKYTNQIQCESLVTGRKHIVFITYDPRMPASQQIQDHDYEADVDLQALMLERVLELETMLFEGRRYTVGRVRVESGVPKIF